MGLKRKLSIGAGAGVVVLVVAAVAAYANLTRIVRAVLEKQVPGLTFASLSVGWNDVSITEVNLKKGDRTVFKVDKMQVKPSLRSLFSDTLYISSIEIDGPYVYLVRTADGLTLPVPQKMGEPAKPKKEEDASPGMGVLIEKIRLRDGKGELVDQSVTGAPAHFTLSKLEVTVTRVALPTGAENIPFELSMQLEGKRVGKLEAEGWYNPKSRSAEVELELRQLFLPHAEPYYRSRQTTAVLSDGVFELDTDIRMTNGKYVARNRLTLAELAFSKEGLFMGVPVAVFQKRLKDQGKPFEIEAELEGSLDDKSKLQQELAALVVKALVKELGQQALGDLMEGVQKGEIKRPEDALNKLFGK